jgi:hypothetical protein
LLHRSAAKGMALFVLIFLAIPIVLPHWLNLRYVSVVFGPLCILAAAGLWWTLEIVRKQLNECDAHAAVTLACAAILIAGIGD